MSRLTDLIAQAKAKDPQAGADLEREFKALSSRLPFGLNFERHRPEAVELPLRPIRKGDKVRVLPERGSTRKGDQRLWQVVRIATSAKRKVADLQLLDAVAPEAQSAPVEDLVVVAEFKDIIYPGLVSTGKVERGGDKPYHTVITAENYHALKALTWSHRGKVDAIYIDPPYNTGARDWKYNNDYVEGDDLYRHSKWLAFMERRLWLAKELLNPADSVLIVTIDEKEYLRLGLLLEQTFPGLTIQMVSVVTNPQGTGRNNEFSRTNEFIFFVFLGNQQVVPTADNMFDRDERAADVAVEWRNLRRRERESVRGARPNQFYPVFVNETSGKIHAVGDALPDDVDAHTVAVPRGTNVVFPVTPRGKEMLWGIVPERLRYLAARGYARAVNGNIQFLNNGTVAAIESGAAVVSGYDEYGGVVAHYPAGTKPLMPKTVWVRDSHNAQSSGTLLLKRLLAERAFPFPKSLYAVEDALRFFVKDKRDGIVLDFFAGSGTTSHAVMRLNRQDGGRRQCISVTNNEVAAEEQVTLRTQGLRPGDVDWEKSGISEHITNHRIVAAITGKTPDDEPITGDYKFNDEFPMAEGFEENAEFFTLTYETPVAVSHHIAFARIAPLLWMRAGSRGRRIEKIPASGWEVADNYGLLTELDQATPFLKAVRKAGEVRIAYIVTDDERRFQALARRLPESVEAVRLYESYLTNFAFANGSEA
ncbi:MAG: site-specific DNA-methyltransferase [Gemmatimonadaceae bacterium]